MKVNIPEVQGDNQCAVVGGKGWRVSGLIKQAEKLPVMELPLCAISLDSGKYNLSLREMVSHIKLVEKADLEIPIILDEDGGIMDGRHRIMKAIFEGKETIKAVRFDVNPSCDWEVTKEK